MGSRKETHWSDREWCDAAVTQDSLDRDTGTPPQLVTQISLDLNTHCRNMVIAPPGEHTIKNPIVAPISQASYFS